MSSDELKDIAEGATKGILNWSLEQIKFFATKLKDYELEKMSSGKKENLFFKKILRR